MVGTTNLVSNSGGALMDVAVGAASSEVVIAANVAVGNTATLRAHLLPVFIPRGSRIGGPLAIGASLGG